MPNNYFATEPAESIARHLNKKIEEYDSTIMTGGIFNRIRKSYRTYYGFTDDGTHSASQVVPGGDVGELALVKINVYRNLIQHLHVMTTAQRPAMEARATNSDYKSQVQTILANGILEYYLREKKVERFLRKATELALVMSEGFIAIDWDATGGEEYGVNPDTGLPVRDGEIVFSNYGPFDLVRDVNKMSWDEQNWVIIRNFRNKYDLAAQYPEHADKIKSIRCEDAVANVYQFMPSIITDGDDVPVYTFYHKKTDSLPDGRMTCFISADILLHDGALPYRDIPVYRICPNDTLNSSFGYSVGFDLLGIQEMVDGVVSSIATNLKNSGTANVWVPPGDDVNYKALSEGCNVFESKVKPETLDLLSINPVMFTFLEMMDKYNQMLSGVNAVLQGQPQESLKSGSALALVATQALQFNSGLQQSYAMLLEDVGTGIISVLRDFAQVPRVAMIVGKHNRAYVKEFTGDDLKYVNRVTVDVSNPISRTTAGRIEMANNLLQTGLIKQPDEYLQIMATGKMEPMIEGQQSELLLIRAENEKLAEGKPVKATALDNHPLHIQEHRTTIAQPDIREEPAVVGNTLNHVMEHIQLMKSTDPALLMLCGIQPLPQGPQMPAPAPQEGMPPGPMEPGAPTGANNLPNEPQMPKIAGTNEQYQPPAALPPAG